jgi:MFS family permease
MALAPNQTVAFTVAPLLGIGSIAFLTASTAIVQIEAAPEMRGRVLALQAMLFLGSTPVGGPIVGWVSEQFGARFAIGLGSVAAVAAGLWGLRRARRAERMAVPPETSRGATADAVGALSAEGPAIRADA